MPISTTPPEPTRPVPRPTSPDPDPQKTPFLDAAVIGVAELCELVGRVAIDEIATIDLPEHHDGDGRLVPARTVQISRPRRLRVYRVEGRDGLFVIAADYRDYEGRVPPAGHVLAAVRYDDSARVRVKLLRPIDEADAAAVRFDDDNSTAKDAKIAKDKSCSLNFRRSRKKATA